MRTVDPTLSWRRLWGPAVASIALIMLEPGTARAEPGVPVPPNSLISDRGVGTISAADRDFVTKVRLAGLWEIPAGEMAQEKSNDSRIQAIGRDIAAQHVVLDELTRNAAKKLKIDLPNKPNSDQQSWLAEMREAEGTDFDQVYIDRLRAAHGKIFPAIATIRSTTRNDTVRKLAQQANQFVATHMTLLESSGIVDFGALPTAPAPSASTAQLLPDQALSDAKSQLPKANTVIALTALLGGLATGALTTKRIMGNRRRPYRPRRPRRSGV